MLSGESNLDVIDASVEIPTEELESEPRSRRKRMLIALGAVATGVGGWMAGGAAGIGMSVHDFITNNGNFSRHEIQAGGAELIEYDPEHLAIDMTATTIRAQARAQVSNDFKLGAFEVQNHGSRFIDVSLETENTYTTDPRFAIDRRYDPSTDTLYATIDASQISIESNIVPGTSEFMDGVGGTSGIGNVIDGFRDWLRDDSKDISATEVDEIYSNLRIAAELSAQAAAIESCGTVMGQLSYEPIIEHVETVLALGAHPDTTIVVEMVNVPNSDSNPLAGYETNIDSQLEELGGKGYEVSNSESIGECTVTPEVEKLLDQQNNMPASPVGQNEETR